jgi:subtilase family serine protease
VNTKHVTAAVPAGTTTVTAPPTSPCALPPGAGTGNVPGTYPDCAGYSPSEFQTAYDAKSTPTGSNTSIAIMAEGDLTQVLKDLRQEETAFGLPQVPDSVVPVGVHSTDTSGADEWDLDTQYSTGMAQTVKHLYIYDTTSLTDSDIGLEFNKWVSQDVAQGASASFGECEEFPYLDGLLVTNDEAMNEAAAQGQTMHASAGDTGAACAVAPTNGVPESGPPQVNYPCSSPYIICVGGTSLYTNPNYSYQYNYARGTGYAGETAWQAGGGGVSLNEYAPYWQSCVTPNYAANQRDVPDIAMDADENDGAVVDVAGTFEEIGGTSVSSPLALGVWARLESAHGNRLGFAAPRLYALYPKGTCASGAGVPPTTPLTTPAYPLHDVFLEGNGVYNAQPGYDLVTGLGSYDVGLVNKSI